MEKRFDPDTKGKENKQAHRKKWYKAVCSLAAAVVVCTVYTLMLPALTLDEEGATNIGVETSAPAATEISEASVPTSEAPDDSPAGDNTDAAADSSADSSQNNAESGTAADAPSADSAANTPTDQPSTLPAADDQSNGVVTGEGQSADEAPAPDANADDSNNDSDNSSNEDSNNEENSSSSSSSDADNEDISDPTADVEDASIWESTIPDLSECSTWAEKLLLVASSQIGYQESAANFEVLNGEHKGYTRYGEWYGNPYGNWCAMFVSFCLNYAGIDSDIIPHNANCQTWVEQLRENKIFEDPDTYLPEPGDIVFFDQSGSGNADHVGIVSDVEYETKTVTRHVVVGTETAVEDSPLALLSYANSVLSADIPVETLESEETETTVAKSIEVIEGNSSDQVQPVTYDMTDSSILGLASLYEAEYIHNGGDINDIKNSTQINQPVTLENKDMLAVQAITGGNTVTVGNTITLTGGNSNWNACNRNDSWSSDNNNIATVSGNDNYATVTGISSGSVTITHTYCNKSDWNHQNHQNHNSKGTEKITITVVENVEENVHSAAIYYLNDPESDNIETNVVGDWRPTKDSGNYYKYVGEVNVEGATWKDNKNIVDTTSVAKYVSKWPGEETHTENSYWVIDNTNTYFDSILNDLGDSYIQSLGKKAGINDLKKSDITQITLIPRKISKDNGGSYPYHIDCSISITSTKMYLAKFSVKDIESGQYSSVDNKWYQMSQLISETDKIKIGSVKTVNGIHYVLTGWYKEDSDGNPYGDLVTDWQGGYTPSKNELSDGIVNFYAHYESATVNYKVASNYTNYGKVSLEKENLIDENGKDFKSEDLIGSTPTANDGWEFAGWYYDDECNNPVPPEWINADGTIKPHQTAGSWENVKDKTYYAKFTAGVQLPETGGPGTTLLYLLGALLTTAALTITFIKRRKSASEEN